MDAFHLHFVGVGPQRTGTSWLYLLLQHHPRLCFPKDVKETMFFDCYYENGLSWYTAHFVQQQGDQLCGEISPTYFDVESAAARIYQLNPRCRIIINLRDPVSRAVSLYQHHLSRGRVSGTFTEAVSQMPRIVDVGRYARHIPTWLKRFGEDRVTFVLLDDIDACPKAVLTKVYDFLGVESVPMPDMGNEKINAATMPRFPRLAQVSARLVTTLRAYRFHKVVEVGKALKLNKVYTGAERDEPELTVYDRYSLLEQYETDIRYVERLLGRDLTAWRHPNDSELQTEVVS
ncbi:MAG: sulfotransferase domain-containing protein [Candidatus Binatia bacterium]